VAAYFSHRTPVWGSGITDGAGNLTVGFVATASGRVRHVAKMQGSTGRLRRAAQATLVVDPATAAA
jgi:hypothetical protein